VLIGNSGAQVLDSCIGQKRAIEWNRRQRIALGELQCGTAQDVRPYFQSPAIGYPCHFEPSLFAAAFGRVCTFMTSARVESRETLESIK
jgi:hypothetical protein